MADATVSRLGQIQAAGDTEALWLKLFSGEVLTAYDKAKKLKPTVRVRQISSGKSAQFPATFNAIGRYHTPGAEIVGQAIQHNEVVVTLDDLLIADAFIAEIDELKNHYDVRAPYSEAIGRALALIEDRTIGQNLVIAARDTTPLFTGDGAGSAIVEADIPTSDFDASGADLVTAIQMAKEDLDQRDVPVDSMAVHAVFKPAQWYLIARTDQNLNRDYSGQASFGQESLRTVSNVNVIKSNAVLFGSDVTLYNVTTNADGVVGDPAGTLPVDYPTKYRADLVNTRGVVYVEPAVAYLQLMGMKVESNWDFRRQGTLLLAKMAIGMGKLRAKCAVEIKTA